MRASRACRVVARVLSPILSFQEIRQALRMVASALIPALVVFLVFQCSLPEDAMTQICRIDRSAVKGHDLAPMFNYYIAWAAHVLVSVAVALGAAHSAFRDTSEPKKTTLRQFRILVS